MPAAPRARKSTCINNNLKTPYSDQFSLGIRNKVGDWNTDATVQHIVGKDGLVFTLGNRYPSGAFWESCGSGCVSQPWGNGVPGFGSFIIGNNGLETKTTQVLLSAEKPYTKESGWAATFAYTYTNTKQNNDNNDLTDQYAFDEATIGDYPFMPSKVAKHRFVATGSVDGPWDMLYSMKLTLATPLPDDNLACSGGDGAPNVPFPTGSLCTPVSAYPVGQSFITGGKIFGYRSIDLQATKNFDLTAGLSAYIRVDCLERVQLQELHGLHRELGFERGPEFASRRVQPHRQHRRSAPHAKILGGLPLVIAGISTHQALTWKVTTKPASRALFFQR